jgi:hypothetical protein
MRQGVDVREGKNMSDQEKKEQEKMLQIRDRIAQD